MEGRFEGRRIPFQFSSLSLLRGSVVPRPMWQDVLGKLVAGTSSQSCCPGPSHHLHAQCVVQQSVVATLPEGCPDSCPQPALAGIVSD